MRQPAFEKIVRLTGKAIGDFQLIEEGDRILVALSGGKDSWSLLYALLHLQRKAPVRYEVGAATVTSGADYLSWRAMEKRLAEDGVGLAFIHGDIPALVRDHLTPGTNPCSFVPG
jgi:tRNA 2-thiocytidine biosynthesis protein TtcA